MNRVPEMGNGSEFVCYPPWAQELFKKKGSDEEKEAPGNPRGGCFVSAWVLAVGINAL
jgi:hypothetical protein